MLDGGVTLGMRGVGDSCVGHSGMLGIFTLGGAGAYGILGGGGTVGTLGSGVSVGTLGGGGAGGTGTLGGRAGITDHQVIGGMVGVAGLGTGRTNCIRACVCSISNFAVGEAGCGRWRVAMSLWIQRVIFSCGERPGRTWSRGKK